MSARRGRLASLVAMCLAVGLLLGAGPTATATADPVLPAPPATVSISQRSTMAILTWSAATAATPTPASPVTPTATGYAVDIDTDVAFPAPRRVTTSGTVAVLTGLAPDSTYFVRVAGWDPATNTTGAWGATASFTTPERAYAHPAPAVTLTARSTTSITAEWTELGAGLRYQAIMGTDPLQLSGVRRTKGNRITWTKLAANTKYYVRVRAVDASGDAVTAWSRTGAVATPETMPLRVGSYNILCENCSRGKASWATRRGPLVDTIRGQDLDVLGLQEASIASIPDGGPQYMDLIRRLGSPYKLTEYGRNVSPDIRIIYNAERLTMKKQGIVALPVGLSRRFLDWAVFEQKATGKTFFFCNTHLEPKDGRAGWASRKQQTAAVIAAIRRLSNGLPVIAVGDYASTKWERWGNAPYDAMLAAGYLDPLGNAYRSHDNAPGAFVEKRINTSYASLNMYRRKARNFPGDVNGSNTDYIFLTKMRVSEYEVVVRVDAAGRFIGVIPSDHNLLRATVYLP